VPAINTQLTNRSCPAKATDRPSRPANCSTTRVPPQNLCSWRVPKTTSPLQWGADTVGALPNSGCFWPMADTFLICAVDGRSRGLSRRRQTALAGILVGPPAPDLVKWFSCLLLEPQPRPGDAISGVRCGRAAARLWPGPQSSGPGPRRAAGRSPPRVEQRAPPHRAARSIFILCSPSTILRRLSQARDCTIPWSEPPRPAPPAHTFRPPVA
jgi:hypothetical protein